MDLTPQVKEALEDLQERTSAASLVEVIRRALVYYELLVEQEEAEGRIILENKDGTRERVKVV